MPYRRLPNTDLARLRALKTALEVGQKLSVSELAFSSTSLARVRTFFPGFESAIIQHKQARKEQLGNSKKYNEIVRKARLYTSHFLHVMNFCILRGEMKKEVREYYGLSMHDPKLPSLQTDESLIEWGKKIIEGEHQRTIHGGSAIYNPSIAVVKVKFDQFADAYHFQKTLQNNTSRWTDKVVNLRKEADELILNIWNEVEAHYQHDADEIKRQKAERYGLVYFYRPNEKKKMEAERLQRNLEF